MGVIVADTSILIDHLRGLEAAATAIDTALASDDDVVASVVTRAELLAGMRAHEKRPVRRLMARLRWLQVDRQIADTAGDLGRTYRASLPGVDIADYLIAATAIEAEATFWTRNLKHFPMFEDLRAPY